MICTKCVFYRPPGRTNPLTPVCLWKANEEQLAVLQSMLPAPTLSRLRVLTSPTNVEQCSAYSEDIELITHKEKAP